MAASIKMDCQFLSRKNGAVLIDGVHTDIISAAFEDKLYMVFTQYEKVGTLILVSKDKVMAESRGELIYTTTCLLGKDEPEHHVIARGLASKISTNKPILFSLGLKDTSPKMLRALCDILDDYKCW